MSWISSRKRTPSAKSQDGISSAAPVIKPVHPSSQPIEACEYSTEGLQFILKNPDTIAWAKHLDFARCRDEQIETLFVTDRDRIRNKNLLLPPRALRRTAKGIREFLQLGADVQRDRYAAFLQFDGDLDDGKRCVGISMATLFGRNLSEDAKAKANGGFIQLVRESEFMAYKYKDPNNYRWPTNYCSPIVGIIVVGSNEYERIEWTVEYIPGFPIDTNQYSHMVVRHHTCQKQLSIIVDPQICAGCLQFRPSLLQKCNAKFKLRATALHPNTNHLVLYRNPSLTIDKLNLVTANLRKHQRNRYFHITAKLTKTAGVMVPINDHSDDLFGDPSKMDHYFEFLDKQNVTNSTLAKFVVAAAFAYLLGRWEAIRRHCEMGKNINFLFLRCTGDCSLPTIVVVSESAGLVDGGVALGEGELVREDVV